MLPKIAKHICLQYTVIFTVLVLLTAGCIHAHGQEMFGITVSDYNGISSAVLNPALMTSSRTYLDVNIVSGDLFFDNSMYYLPVSFNSFPKFINGDFNIYEGQFKYGRSFTYFENTDEKFLSAMVRLNGPSFMFQAGKHAFGLTTAFRSIQSGNRIPYEIPLIAYEEIGYDPIQRIEFNDHQVNLTGMSWGEIGLSYAYNLIDHLSNRLTIGASFKALLGVEGAYIAARNVNYIIVDSATVNILNFDADFGYSVPLDAQTNQVDFSPLIRGFGLAADLGIIFAKKRSAISYDGEDLYCAQPYQDYIYKVGLSLLDFGALSFNNTSELHRFDNVNRYWEDFDTIRFQSISQTLQGASTVFYGDANASYVANSISIGMPTAVSFQFDYHFNFDFYLGLVWIHPLQVFKNTIWRPAQVAVIPRYENRYFGFSLPVSLFHYSKPRVGFSVRIYSITLGTDNLGSWFGATDFTGTNIYFSFKFNLRKGNCSSSKKGACDNQDFGQKKKKSRRRIR